MNNVEIEMYEKGYEDAINSALKKVKEIKDICPGDHKQTVLEIEKEIEKIKSNLR